MLITFQTDAYESIMLFGDVARTLLKMMGHSDHVPGAILAKDVPTALALLTQAIDQEKKKLIEIRSLKDDHEHEISIVHRAIPVIALLEAASRKECDVLWS